MTSLKGFLENTGYYNFLDKVMGYTRGTLGANKELVIEVVVQEAWDMSFDAPEKPVEAGFSIVDGMSKRPETFNMVITSNRASWKEEKALLISMANAMKPINYFSPIDKKEHTHMVIEGLSFDPTSKQKYGFTANFKLKKVVEIKYNPALRTIEDVKPGNAQGAGDGGGGAQKPTGDGNKTSMWDNGLLKMFNEKGTGISGALLKGFDWITGGDK